MNNTEVMTFPDRDSRNRVYDDLRSSGNDLERQVVRFSDVEPTGEKRIVIVGKGRERTEYRLVHRSTYSVGYPRS